MKIFEVRTIDDDFLYVSVLHVAMAKLHPTRKKPQSGYIVLSSGKELFLHLESYYKLMEALDVETKFQ